MSDMTDLMESLDQAEIDIEMLQYQLNRVKRQIKTIRKLAKRDSVLASSVEFTPPKLERVTGKMTVVRNRLANIISLFKWQRNR
jgi:hypothetical protein